MLADLFIMQGTPSHIRSDNDPKFVATAVKELIAGVGAKTAYIELADAYANKVRRTGFGCLLNAI